MACSGTALLFTLPNLTQILTKIIRLDQKICHFCFFFSNFQRCHKKRLYHEALSVSLQRVCGAERSVRSERRNTKQYLEIKYNRAHDDDEAKSNLVSLNTKKPNKKEINNFSSRF
jgi:hypothetical protein